MLDLVNSDGGWESNKEEDFNKLTVTPSVWLHCESDPHFYINDGKIDLL